jgi:hypothetical protein
MFLGSSYDGGCLAAIPAMPPVDCSCNANPTVSVYAGCYNEEVPCYFNSLDDMPNGVCIMDKEGKKGKYSVTTCQNDGDCVDSLTCRDGKCADNDGVPMMDRIVTTCVSPKGTSKSDMAGCGYSDADHIINCHKFWIEHEGMQWKRYLQHNPFGPGVGMPTHGLMMKLFALLQEMNHQITDPGAKIKALGNLPSITMET